MSRLTPEQYAEALESAENLQENVLPTDADPDLLVALALLDAHERAEAAEKRLSNLPDCPSCNGRGGHGSGGTDVNTGEWMSEGCEDCGMSSKAGLWPETAAELANLRQRLAAAEARLAAIADDDGFYPTQDGRLTVLCSDTWGFACADAEEVTDGELPLVREMNKRFGYPGIAAWVAIKRGCDPMDAWMKKYGDKYREARSALTPPAKEEG